MSTSFRLRRTIIASLASVMFIMAVLFLFILRGSSSSVQTGTALDSRGRFKMTAPLRPGDDRFGFKYVFGILGLVTNVSDRTVVLQRVSVGSLHPRVALTNTAAFVLDNRGFFDAICGPLPLPGWSSRPIKGFRIKPQQNIAILIEVQNRHHVLGTVFTSLRVEYLAGSQPFVQTFPEEAAFSYKPEDKATCVQMHARP